MPFEPLTAISSVDGRYHAALPRQGGSDELAALGVGADALLGTAVAVQADNRGDWPRAVFRDQEDTGDETPIRPEPASK